MVQLNFFNIFLLTGAIRKSTALRRSQVIMEIMTKSGEDNENKKDLRLMQIHSLKRLLTEYPSINSFFASLVLAMVLNILYFLGCSCFFIWILEVDASNLSSLSELITLAFNTSRVQRENPLDNRLRHDRLIQMFPSSFGCILYQYGTGGDLTQDDIKCSAPSNALNEKIHVLGLFISIAFFVLVILDFVFFLFSLMVAMPHSKSLGNIATFDMLKSFPIGKRLLWSLLEKNSDVLFWKDFTESMTKEFSPNSKKKQVKTKDVEAGHTEMEHLIQQKKKTDDVCRDGVSVDTQDFADDGNGNCQ